MSNHDALSIWQIFDRPRDYPDGFIARRFDVFCEGPRRGETSATDDTIKSTNLEYIRSIMMQKFLHRMPRLRGDPPFLVECWI